MRTAKQWSNALSRKILSRLYIDRGDYRGTVFIAGTGRSGTTWLEELINFEHDHRVLFEPFNSHDVPLVAHWNYRQYLRNDDDDERYVLPARRILSGNIRHPWVDQANSKHWVRRRLVKDIRANLILFWVRQQFPEIPIILLLRHPCAVARSKMAMGWRTHLDALLSQQALVEDFLLPFVPLLESARDDFDRHILLWCVENWVPLCQFQRGEIHVCLYEHLCAEPEQEARSLLAYLGRDFDPEILACVSKPSALSKAHSAILTGSSMLDSWRQSLEPSQTARAIELLGYFGLDRIYGTESLPRVRGQDVLDLFGPNTYGAPQRPVSIATSVVI